MGKTARREYIVIVPDKYWTSSFEDFQWIIKESKCQNNCTN